MSAEESEMVDFVIVIQLFKKKGVIVNSQWTERNFEYSHNEW